MFRNFLLVLQTQNKQNEKLKNERVKKITNCIASVQLEKTNGSVTDDFLTIMSFVFFTMIE